MNTCAINEVKLIIVMRDKGFFSQAIDCLMIGINITEVAPTILVDTFTLFEKRIGPIDNIRYVSKVLFVGIIKLGNEIWDGLAISNPCRIH